MNFNKATFRALREEVGVSHSDLACIFKVHPSSVKRWEDENYPHTPPQEIAEALMQILDHRNKMAENAVEKAEVENAKTVNLVYYKNRNNKNAYLIKIKNADTRAKIKALHEAGVEVSLTYAD